MTGRTLFKSEYAQKLLDPRWQKLRLEAQEAAGWKCAACWSGLEDGKTLHVHHRQYFKGREPWEYEVAQLEVLCKDCHSEHHQEIDALALVASYAPMDGPGNRDSCSLILQGYLGIQVNNGYRKTAHYQQRYWFNGRLLREVFDAMAHNDLVDLSRIPPEKIIAALKVLAASEIGVRDGAN